MSGALQPMKLLMLQFIQPWATERNMIIFHHFRVNVVFSLLPYSEK
jgi:hypothetical protein